MRTKYVLFQLAWSGAVTKNLWQVSGPHIFWFAILANQTNIFFLEFASPLKFSQIGSRITFA